MPVNEKRSLIQLDTNLAISLPKGWTKFWKMTKGEKIQVLYDSILVIIPSTHPKRKEVEKKVEQFLIK